MGSEQPPSLRCAWQGLIVGVAILLPFQQLAFAADGRPEIGTAVTIKREVVATLGEEKRDLHEGSRVHRTEYLETGDKAHAELKLDDQTKLVLGPNAGLKLDDFVIGQSGGVKSIGVNFIKGTFRFITGAEKKDAYRIDTPSATIGVRGTVFDIYVAGNGDTLVLLQEGEVDICTKTKRCRRHSSVGRIVHATIGGVLSDPLKFSRGLIPGLGVGRAFPFVGKTLRIDPIRRLRTADIVVSPARRAAGAVTNGARSIGRTLRRAVPF